MDLRVGLYCRQSTLLGRRFDRGPSVARAQGPPAIAVQGAAWRDVRRPCCRRWPALSQARPPDETRGRYLQTRLRKERAKVAVRAGLVAERVSVMFPKLYGFLWPLALHPLIGPI